MQQNASLLIDIANMRCSLCKMLVKDELARSCEHCGSEFDRVSSNHAGLARRLQKIRDTAFAVETNPDP